MAIRMKEWGMLAAPGQSVHVRTQGLHGWERIGYSLGKGISDVVMGLGKWGALAAKVNSTGELAAFTEELKGMSAEVNDELKEREVRDWDYAWETAMAPRINEAVQRLSAESRAGAMEMARQYSAQSSIEARRDRDMHRISTARSRWEQQVEASIAAGQEEQAARWMEAARGVFVPEEEMENRVAEVRSRACHSRLEGRLQAAPLEALSEIAEVKKQGKLPIRKQEERALEQSCERARQGVRRELAMSFSECLRTGEELEPATLELAARAGIIPPRSRGKKAAVSAAEPPLSVRSAWRRWLDSRADGDEEEEEVRLTLATAPLPLAERRALLARLECTAKVPATDRRTLSNRLWSLYSAGAFGCPGDAEAQQALFDLQEEGVALLAEQGAAAVADWVEARRAGVDNWVCYEEEEPHRKSSRR